MTGAARYEVEHSGGQSRVVVGQNETEEAVRRRIHEPWVTLGYFSFDPSAFLATGLPDPMSAEAVVRLQDAAWIDQYDEVGDSCRRRIYADAIRVRGVCNWEDVPHLVDMPDPWTGETR